MVDRLVYQNERHLKALELVHLNCANKSRVNPEESKKMHEVEKLESQFIENVFRDTSRMDRKNERVAAT